MEWKTFIVLTIALCTLCIMITQGTAFASGVTQGSNEAQKFGVHEITLTGNEVVENPFDTIAQVKFTSPSGSSRTVYAFYDGDNIWRARVYTDEVGQWSWETVSETDELLNGNKGTFTVKDSSLPGKLIKHPEDSKALATDNGEWFLNIADTAYYLFHDDSTQWKEFIEDDWKLGVNCLRANLLGNLREASKQQNPDGWDRVFTDDNKDKMNLPAFRTTDERLDWMLENYPGMYVQMIITPEPSTWKKDEVYWRYLSSEQKERYLRYVVARYAAYPQIFWLITNDAGYSSSNPYNVALANEIGTYLLENDPWTDKNLRSTGRNRDESFYFTDADWANYIHIETKTALSADQVENYTSVPMHVYNGEDWYEGEKSITNDAYFFRRLFWSWTLSGGSATYGGYWNKVVAYHNTTFTGLDDIIHIKNFFADNNIALNGFKRDNSLVTGPTGTKKVVIMKNADNTQFVLYHPNAASDGGSTAVNTSTASMTLNNLTPGYYRICWTKADDGTTHTQVFTHESGDKVLSAPWSGIDVAAHIKKIELTDNGLAVSGFDFISGNTIITSITATDNKDIQGRAILSNTNDQDQSAVIVIAHYSGDKLIKCTLSEKTTVAQNSSTILTPSINTSAMKAGDIVKLFLWNDAQLMDQHLKPKTITVK